MNLEQQNMVPAMIKGWIQDMLDRKQNSNFRQNRYMALEVTYRAIGEALKRYESAKK